ncbi:MAG: hemerythrin domain-containing protein [Pirellulales bacterium]|nr:hemerythrin domain-containing protein [Pirellulales bacterium]
MTVHSHAYYEDVLREHRELLAVTRRIREALDAHRGGKSSLPTMFSELASHLTAHFAFESEDGYLSEALENAPHLQSQADELESQHPKLLAAVMEMRDLVNREEESDGWWQQLVDRFDSFSEMLIEHERDENRLVQEALDRDTGSKD